MLDKPFTVDSEISDIIYINYNKIPRKLKSGDFCFKFLKETIFYLL